MQGPMVYAGNQQEAGVDTYIEDQHSHSGSIG